MNRWIVLALVLTGVCIGTAAARPTGFGLGLMGGDPSGLSFKAWTGDRTAIDGGLGYSYIRYGSAPSIHIDALWHTQSVVDEGDGFLPFYIGIGGRVKFADEPRGYPDMRLGVRIPFGVEYVFPVFPLGLFFELVPVFNLSPWSEWWDGNSSIGFRYYFGGSD